MTFPPAGMRLEIFSKAHDRKGFSCGEAEVDAWLHHKALSAQNKHGSTTRVLLDGDRIAGFFTLANTHLAVDAVPAELFPGGQVPRREPATVTLAWLGVDKSYAGRGLGTELTMHALSICYRVYQDIRYLAVIVEALTDRSEAFFIGFGFGRIPGTHRKLYLSAAALSAAVGGGAAEGRAE